MKDNHASSIGSNGLALAAPSTAASQDGCALVASSSSLVFSASPVATIAYVDQAISEIDLSTYAVDSAVVHNIGNENIAGNKNFTSPTRTVALYSAAEVVSENVGSSRSIVMLADGGGTYMRSTDAFRFQNAAGSARQAIESGSIKANGEIRYEGPNEMVRLLTAATGYGGLSFDVFNASPSVDKIALWGSADATATVLNAKSHLYLRVNNSTVADSDGSGFYTTGNFINSGTSYANELWAQRNSSTSVWASNTADSSFARIASGGFIQNTQGNFQFLNGAGSYQMIVAGAGTFNGGNVNVDNPEGTGAVVRLGSAFYQPGIYSSTVMNVITGGDYVYFSKNAAANNIVLNTATGAATFNGILNSGGESVANGQVNAIGVNANTFSRLLGGNSDAFLQLNSGSINNYRAIRFSYGASATTDWYFGFVGGFTAGGLGLYGPFGSHEYKADGSVIFGGSVACSGVVKLGTFVASALPSASANSGASAVVVDAVLAFISANIGATVSGGGSEKVRVFSNGTNWVIG